MSAASVVPVRDEKGDRLRGPGLGWARSVVLPGAVTIWCLHSLLAPGYVLQIDAVFGPHMEPSLGGVAAPLTLLAHLLGGYWAGRVFVGGAVFLCAFGPMVLLRRLSWVAQVPAGLLGALNPFVYDRVVEGQWGVAAGAGAIFLWLAAWERLEAEPSKGRLLLTAGAGWLAMVLDQHTIGPLLLLAVGSLLWHRRWRQPLALLFGLGSFAVLAVGLAYALPPFFLGSSSTYYSVQHFSLADLLEFRATPSPRYGLWLNLLGLYGFWAERLGRIPMVNQGAPWWPVAGLVLLGLALWGAWLARQRAWLLACGLLGILIAGSTATAPGREVFLWLMHRIPLVGAFREPQKWSELWLLALVVLGAEAVDRAVDSWRGAPWARLPALAMVAATLLPAGLGMLRETPATIRAYRYPAGWIQAAAYLQSHVRARTPVLILPWTLYEQLPFTGNLLTANPAPSIFPGNLISPNDLQIPGAVTESRAPGDLTEIALDPLAPHCGLARGIRRLKISWVLVEPAPGGIQAAASLTACGFSERFGEPPGLLILEG